MGSESKRGWLRRLHDFRDAILPLLEGKPKPHQVCDTLIGAYFPALKRALEVGQLAFQTEENRRSTIQSKATTIIGSTSVAVSILGLRSDLTGATRGLPTWLVVLAGSFLAITLFYFVVAILNAARVLFVSGHAVISPETMTPGPTESEELFISRLTKQYGQATQVNSYNNDRRTDYLILAQLYLRNGVLMLMVLVVIYGVALPIVSLTSTFPKMASITEEDWNKNQQTIGVLEKTLVGLEQRLIHVERSPRIGGVSSGDLRITGTNVESIGDGTLISGTITNSDVRARTAVIQVDALGQNAILVSSLPLVVEGIPANGFRVFSFRLPFRDSDELQYQLHIISGF